MVICGRMQGRQDRRGHLWILVALTALSASIAGVTNQYTQDDIPLIRDDTRVHSFSEPGRIFLGTYWPPPHAEYLYRPLATATFAVQWALGDGSPLVFRLGSYTLYAASAVAVWWVARMLLPTGVALGISALFAAHPVHVEAVALGVNQSELWVGVLTTLALGLYLRARQRGPLGGESWALLSALYLVACLFKENALVLPGILVAAELLLVRDRGLSERVKLLGPGYLTLIGVATVFWAVRTAIVGGGSGTFAAEAVAGQGTVGRVLTMLQVVPDWLRLLAWPARLSGDYSPAVITQAVSWGWPQALGTGLLAALIVTGFKLRQRSAVATFGLLWVAIGLFPVSNILVPTGIALAERTLFLPSIGFLLMVGGIVELFLAARTSSYRLRQSFTIVTLALVLAGTVRSGARHTDWRSQEYYWAKTVEFDAPLSYRAHMAFGQLLFEGGYEARSIQHYHTAMALYPPGYWVHNDLADKYRRRGLCVPALELYAESLKLGPHQTSIRASRIACLLHLGRYLQARLEAEEAIAFGKDVEDFLAYRAMADSAARVNAPVGTVAITIHDSEDQR